MNTDKPTLVMVHGLIGSLTYFDPASRITNAKVRACDLLGYGAYKGVEPDRLTMSAQADHVAEYLDGLGCDKVWLLGHSMGGAVVMMVTDRRPRQVCGIINVEGNFTLRDAFWSGVIAKKTPARWADEFARMRRDVRGWLRQCDIDPTPQRESWMARILAHQPASTMQAMSRALVGETRAASYRDLLLRVVDRRLPLHLIAGEKSGGKWGVPDFVREAAHSYREVPEAGHVMMLEQPAIFCELVDGCLTA